MKLRTLVLNADLSPIEIFPELMTIPAEDAITRVLNGTSVVVAEYDRLIKTPNHEIKWPSVIATKEYVDKKKAAHLHHASLYYRDHGVCAYCNAPLTINTTTKDHVMPRSKGGPDTWENVVAACSNCNFRKGNSLPTGMWVPKVRPYRPSYYQLLDLRRNYPITIGHPSWSDFLGKWNAEVKVIHV